MASNINYESIDTTYPVPGKDNSTQGMRNNFTAISQALQTANEEITQLQLLQGINETTIRHTKTYTTSLLEVDNSETFEITNIGTGCFIYKITTTYNSCVRIYCDIASRAADNGRGIGEPVPANNGLIAEVNTVGNIPYRLTPAIYAFNDEDPRTSTLYFTIINTNNATHAIEFEIVVLPIEASI